MRRIGEATSAAGVAGVAGARAPMVRRAAPPGVSPEAAFLMGLVPDEDESWIPSGPRYLDLQEWSRAPHRGVIRWMSERDALPLGVEDDVADTIKKARAAAVKLSSDLFASWGAAAHLGAVMQGARGRFPKPVRDSLSGVAAGIDALMARASDLRRQSDRALGRLAPAAPPQ